MTAKATIREGEPSFFKKIKYDIGLEEKAFKKLSALDTGGCRHSFGLLLERLDLSGIGQEWRLLQLILTDLLLRVNMQVHRFTLDRDAELDRRQEIIAKFAGMTEAEDARRHFVPLLNSLLLYLASRPGSQNGLVERARQYIEENYRNRISLSTISAHLHVSPNHLSRIFRRVTGQTITESIQRQRLKHAMFLLTEGKHSISEIAYLVGYQNYRDFYRNFVKYQQASPRQVQRRLLPDRS